jgi:hypothetical protein
MWYSTEHFPKALGPLGPTIEQCYGTTGSDNFYKVFEEFFSNNFLWMVRSTRNKLLVETLSLVLMELCSAYISDGPVMANAVSTAHLVGTGQLEVTDTVKGTFSQLRASHTPTEIGNPEFGLMIEVMSKAKLSFGGRF